MGLDLFHRLFRPLIMKAAMKIGEKTTDRCKLCKGELVESTSYLCLLPVMFGDSHEESAEYYLENAKLIEDLSQIPNGKRACYMYVFQCQGCGYKEVSVVDFLQVRDNMVIKGGGTYPYEKFGEFLNQF